MYGICINSGLAVGIDTAAHLGAIDEIGKTVAVLGCGLNKVYPKENEELFRRIIEKGGAVISEYDNNAEAESFRFVERNRIVSGLSIGVLVVESAYRSGTSITANFALQQQKPVFCIPHNISDKLGVGTNKLLKTGAKCVVTPEDILNEYEMFKEVKIKKENINSLNIESIPKEYKPIVKMLVDKPVHINELCKKAKLSITEISADLTILELEGYIKKLPGNMYTLN